MQRQVADIRTRFAVVGLDAVQAAFRSTADVLGRVTSISRTAGAAAGASGDAAREAARRAAEAAREQVRATVQAAQEQLRQAQAAARQQSELARQQARERDLDGWGLDRLLAVAASLGLRAEIRLVPAEPSPTAG